MRVAILYSLRINVFRRTHFVTLIENNSLPEKKNYAFYVGIRRIRIPFTPQRHLLDYERIR